MNRAAIHPSQPFLVHKEGGDMSKRWQMFQAMESQGMGVARIRTDAVLRDLKEELPDMAQDPLQSQENVTDSLKYLVCNGGLENGDPCQDYKFNVEPCTITKWQVKWHPGW